MLKNEAANAHRDTKLLAEALHSLPEEKRNAVLLYYFFEMTDVEIAKLYNVPRSTVQYRRKITPTQYKANRIRSFCAEPFGGCAMTSIFRDSDQHRAAKQA